MSKNISQSRAPLAEAMRQYASGGCLAFHTPGHKQGLGASSGLRDLITAEGLREEVSLASELDDLHAPAGCLKEAEELAAHLFGADEAFFMVNGTTGAIHTALMGALQPGDEIILPRNAHRSVIGGAILAGLKPFFAQPAINERLGIAMGLELSSVKKALQEHPKAKALLVTSPNYYGVSSDLVALGNLTHSQNKLLLVDEAHGAHLAFSAYLPPAAMETGADMAAQSTHKLLGSLTQTSILLAKKRRVDINKLRKAASLLQSTSPNYLLLASLDLSRKQMAEFGSELVGRAVNLAAGLREKINYINGLHCFGHELAGTLGVHGLDTTKLTVSVRGLGLSGTDAFSILRHEYNIQAELADAYNVLFIISYADTEKEAARLLQALASLAENYRKGNISTPAICLPPMPKERLNARDAFFAPTEKIPFQSSSGFISAEQIMFYPPGIPIIYPGEEITSEIIEYVGIMKKLGLQPMGMQDTSLQNINVIKDV